MAEESPLGPGKGPCRPPPLDLGKGAVPLPLAASPQHSQQPHTRRASERGAPASYKPPARPEATGLEHALETSSPTIGASTRPMSDMTRALGLLKAESPAKSQRRASAAASLARDAGGGARWQGGDLGNEPVNEAAAAGGELRATRLTKPTRPGAAAHRPVRSRRCGRRTT